jgi:3-deoxy-D-manno-octulosonic-acid transferase
VGLPEHSMTLTGALKQEGPPLSCDPGERDALRHAIGANPIWCAASTHPGEDEIVLKAHKSVAGLLIIVPRHIERGTDIAEKSRQAGFVTAQRSLGDDLTTETEVYVADTMGELGLWYSLASRALVCGSLVPIGGHNPFEAAQFDCAILHGPFVGNFRDIYARLDQADAAYQVSGAAELSDALNAIDSARQRAMSARTNAIVKDAGGGKDVALAAILARL